MKKIILLLITLFCLISCSKKEQVEIDYYYADMGILVPTGAPSLAFINAIDDSSFETNTNPNNILSQMNNASNKRVVVLETIVGLDAIKKGAPYKMLGTITFGNYYLAATGNDSNKTLDNDDHIVIFSKNQEILFKTIYDGTYNIEIVNGVSDAGKCLAMGINLETGNEIDYVFIAEPVLSKILDNIEVPTYGKSYIYSDIQKEYSNKFNRDIFQASVFIKDDGYIKDVDDYGKYLEENIIGLLNNKEYADAYLKDKSSEEVSMVFGIDLPTIKNVLSTNSINLGFKKASDYKEEIIDYYKLFTGEDLNEEVFIK